MYIMSKRHCLRMSVQVRAAPNNNYRMSLCTKMKSVKGWLNKWNFLKNKMPIISRYFANISCIVGLLTLVTGYQ